MNLIPSITGADRTPEPAGGRADAKAATKIVMGKIK